MQRHVQPTSRFANRAAGLPRRAAFGLLLAVALVVAGSSAPPARAQAPTDATDTEHSIGATTGAHEALCDALTTPTSDLAALRHALERGASPNATCSVAYTHKRIHAVGALMSLLTGGLWLLSPILDEDLLVEDVTRWREVAPLTLAAGRRELGAMRLLLAFGARRDALDGLFAAAIEDGELTWAEDLAAMGAERDLARIPDPVFEQGQLPRVLAMEPHLAGLSLDWNDATVTRFAADPSLLDTLAAAGMPTSALRDGFAAAVAHDELALAGTIAALGGERRLTSLSVDVLADERRLQAVLALDPELSGLHVDDTQLDALLVSNPHALAQLTDAGFDVVDLAIARLDDGDREMLARLLDAGVDPLATTDQRHDRTLMQRAARTGDREALAMLLEHAAVPTVWSPDHPLEAAAEAGHGEIVETLLATMPADAQDTWNGRLLTTAVHDRDLPLTRRILDRATGPLPTGALAEHALRTVDHDALALLLEHSRDPAADAQRCLFAAAEEGRAELLAGLVERGADAAAVDGDGDTALHRTLRGDRATGGSRRSTIAELARLGADLDARDAAGVTPLEHALTARDWSAPVDAAVWEESRWTQRGVSPDELLALLDEGADPAVPLADGRTPLAWALDDWSWYAAIPLLEAGAVPTRRQVRRAVAHPRWSPPPAALFEAMFAASPATWRPGFWARQARRAELHGRDDDTLAALRRVADEARGAGDVP